MRFNVLFFKGLQFQNNFITFLFFMKLSYMATLKITPDVNPLFHNVEKWPKILLKNCGVNTARFLKYVWPFFNIMKQRVNNSLWFLHVVQDLGDSLNVRRNFWCLIMVLKNWCSSIYMSGSCKKIFKEIRNHRYVSSLCLNLPASMFLFLPISALSILKRLLFSEGVWWN